MGRRRKRSRFFNTQFTTSWLSTTLVLVLLGTIVLFMLVARNLSNSMRENLNLTVVVDDIDEDSLKLMQKDFEGLSYVKEVEYISKMQALEEETKAMGFDPSEFIEANPFTASFEVKMKADYANPDSMRAIVKEFRQKANVADVIYQEDLTKSVNSFIKKISIVLLVIAALFTYISFALIHNTVRLTIFSRRFSINTMKLVGASWGFIRRPFLKQAMLLGVLSALLACGLLCGMVYWGGIKMPDMFSIVTWRDMGIVAAAVLVFGLLITFTCTYFSLSKYLKMSSNDLYHV